MVRAIMEAVDYTDYVLDRRLGCRQLGMNLPEKVTTARIPFTYTGTHALYHGATCWSVYFERNYIKGCATDKILPRHYADPEFDRRLARLLGEAAAVNCIVGRANTNDAVIFDDGDEVIVFDDDGLPDNLVVSDHTGAFKQYETPIEDAAQAYAESVNRRAAHLPDTAEFAELYLDAFKNRFERVQQEYRSRRRAFDKLFKHRPVDPAGSFAYRWQCVLARLDKTDAAALTRAIRNHIGALNP